MLGIATPILEMANDIRNALRDAMDCEEFADLRFYRYTADDNTDDVEMNEIVLFVDRSEINTKRLDVLALELAKKLKHHDYADKSVQGYESIVGVFSACGKDSQLLYDITEQITGNDGLEWELEYLPKSTTEYIIRKADNNPLCFNDGKVIVYGDLAEAENDLCVGERLEIYEPTTPQKNIYTINVHRDMVATIAVEAESMAEALRLANEKACLLPAMEWKHCGTIGSCVCNVE